MKMTIHTQFILMALMATSSLAGKATADQVPAIETVQVHYMPGSYAPITTGKISYTEESSLQLETPVLKSPERPKTDLQLESEPKSISRTTPKQPTRVFLPKTSPKPVVNQEGSLVFPFGETLPSVVCAPLHVCEVRLEPGEIIQQIDVGDTIRWQVKLARSIRNGIETAHLIIKPTEMAISSNLIAITDKRTYTIELISKNDQSWMPKVAFSYPDDNQANWNEYFTQHQNQARPSITIANQDTPAPSLDSKLNFKYQLKGDKPSWRPLKVYTDQEKTYIQLPEASKNNELPALVLRGTDHKEQLVNYRLIDNQFIVDQVIQTASLISGVGRHQERVDIVKMRD
jgi:type IV secretion system protein TrbG